jgi:hypothetical protein
MKNKCCLLALVGSLMLIVVVPSTKPRGQGQYPMMDMIANKVIQKYQQSTCEQLWQKKEKPQPRPPMEQDAIQALKNDPQMRTVFINKVAPPIANKLFECGLIP